MNTPSARSVPAPFVAPLPSSALPRVVASQHARETTPIGRGEELTIAALMVFALLPGLAGLLRIGVIATGADAASLGLRTIPSPAPIVIHILAVILYGGLGPLQLSRGLRRRAPRLHRRLGAALLVAGVVAAATGLWMSMAWPPGPADGAVLFVERALVGGGMLIFLLLATTALLRRDFAAHGAHMTRAWALGVGAATQLVTGLPLLLTLGELTTDGRAAQMGLSWLLNLAVAEWAIARRRSSRALATMRR